MKMWFAQRGVAPLFLLTVSGVSACGTAGNAQEVPPVVVAKPTEVAAPAEAKPALAAGTFTNPVVRNAADPWVVSYKGNYYMTWTVGWGVAVRKSPTLAGLANAPVTPIWRGSGPGYETYTRDVWAPEIHFLRGRWYAYFTATDGPDANRRVFCVESEGDDPLGKYAFKGKVEPPNENFYAIDGTVYERPKDKKLFFLWSGRDPQNTGSAQNIYIAPMTNPWTVSGPRVRLSTPEYAWERKGWLVNEGPEVLFRNGKTFVVYSASGGTTPAYSLGLLTNTNGDLLNSASWSKSSVPVFASYEGPEGHVYTPGHNGFFMSPNGKEWWILYHGKEEKDGHWGGRHARAQQFTWRPDDTPDFGHPIPAGVVLAVPAGEKPASLPVASGSK